MKQKLLSIAIPCYNSASYMKNCIESLLKGKDRVEILVVDDGSQKDNTLEIAQEYEKSYPGIVKAIHQNNAGHGGAVNTGLENATGLYFKVVDSDDYLEEKAFLQTLDTLESFEEDPLDLLICNFVYDKQGEKHKKVMEYSRNLPKDRVFGWEDIRPFHKGQYLLMHSLIYRTVLLRECGMKLPEHTFYVDNIYAYQPLPYVKRMYYLNVNLYMYFIGREDQSVNEKIMISRLDQQYRVNKIMIDLYDLSQDEIIVKNAPLQKYMRSYLEIITCISSMLSIRSHDKAWLASKKELWQYLKKQDAGTYRWMRMDPLGSAMHLPGRGGRRLCEAGYSVAQKIYGFN
jgi:glycosyltransferase involved in cell wall biosynthesis